LEKYHHDLYHYFELMMLHLLLSSAQFPKFFQD
jgi:hypothetical protein